MSTTTKPDHTRTRRAIIDLLKASSSALSVKALAQELELTPMAIRLHIHQLRDEGLIAGELEPRTKGRPATVWSLTDAARRFFPDGHEELVVGLLRSMRETFGADGVRQLLQVRAREQSARYRGAMADCGDAEARLERLAELRTAEGYMASVTRDADGALLLVEDHCPICAAARSCQGLCVSELEVFQEAMGDEVEVTRTDHIIAGARRCAYRVVPTDDGG